MRIKRRAMGRKLMMIVLAVLLMAAALPAAASAAPMPSSGSLTIHKYALEDMGDMEPSYNGKPAPTPADAVPLADVEFSVWQVDPGAVTGITTAAQAWPHIMASTLQTGVTDANGEVTFSSLPQGLYYVAETDNSGSTLFCDPFIVSVPMADATTGNWNDHVHAYPKNQSISIDKFVAAAGTTDYYKVNMNLPVAVGERFDWYIRTGLPVDIGTANTESFVITDVLSSYFDYQQGSVKVYIMPYSDSDLKDCTVLGSGDYAVSFNAATNTLTVELTASGISRVKSLVASGDRYSVVEYSCTVNDSAPQGVALYSGAQLKYTRDTTGASSVSYGGAASAAFTLLSADNSAGIVPLASTVNAMTVEVAMQPEVHTGKIEITKLADKTNKLLPGAEFGIAKTKADAQAGNFIATGTTDASGELMFSGLKYGLPGDDPTENSDNTTFWLAEIKAPDGYKLMKDPSEITFNYSQDEDGKYYFARVSVYNVKSGASGETGTSPKTGDISNLPLYLGIMVLALAGIIVLILKKKKAADGAKQ